MTDDETSHPRDLLLTLDAIPEAALSDDDATFEAAVEAFLQVFRAQRGPVTAKYDELAQLLAFEQVLLEQGEGIRAASVKTVRDWLTHGRHQAASLN